jgi:hypothetical protein
VFSKIESTIGFGPWVHEELGLVAHKGGGGSGGGGGSSGKVSWPTYLQNCHERWLLTGIETNVSIDDAIEEAWDNSPYVDVASYDPEDMILASQARFDATDTLISALDPIPDWESFVAEAIAKVEADILSSAHLADAVDDFDQRQVPQLQRAIARTAAGMMDINAVMNSSFVQEIAWLESQHAQEVSRFNRELSLQQDNQRSQLIQWAVGELKTLHMHKIERSMAAAQLQAELNRVAIVAYKEETDREVELSVKHATWNLELWQYGANLLAAISGGTTGPGNPQQPVGSPISAMGGTISGAASGAMAGTAVLPGWGTAIGAVVGGAAGYLGSS